MSGVILLHLLQPPTKLPSISSLSLPRLIVFIGAPFNSLHNSYSLPVARFLAPLKPSNSPPTMSHAGKSWSILPQIDIFHVAPLYNVGWSHGKERLSNQLNFAKVSCHFNLITDHPTTKDEKSKNVASASPLQYMARCNRDASVGKPSNKGQVFRKYYV